MVDILQTDRRQGKTTTVVDEMLALDGKVSDAVVLCGATTDEINHLLRSRLADGVMRANADRITTKKGTTYHLVRERRWERFAQGHPCVGTPLWVDNADLLEERFSDLYCFGYFDVQTITATGS